MIDLQGVIVFLACLANTATMFFWLGSMETRIRKVERNGKNRRDVVQWKPESERLNATERERDVW